MFVEWTLGVYKWNKNTEYLKVFISKLMLAALGEIED
jgi:hypothetical protein